MCTINQRSIHWLSHLLFYVLICSDELSRHTFLPFDSFCSLVGLPNSFFHSLTRFILQSRNRPANQSCTYLPIYFLNHSFAHWIMLFVTGSLCSPVTDDLLNCTLEFHWGTGDFVRRFTLCLSPPHCCVYLKYYVFSFADQWLPLFV